jgi:type I restriction enzyme S subunit
MRIGLETHENAVRIEDEDHLPIGWRWVKLGLVCDINPPKPPYNALPQDAQVTFVPMPAVDEQTGRISAPRIGVFGELRNRYTAFRDGDVIMAKITPCMENGKAAIARGLQNGFGFGSSEFHVLRPTGSVLAEFIYYFIRRERFRRAAESEMTGSVGQKRVPRAFLATSRLPLAPLAEQKRIVAKVEELLAHINSAREHLDRVPSILTRFRRAVLAAACSGRLTADWRQQQEGATESADELLDRILLARGSRYEALNRQSGATRGRRLAAPRNLKRQKLAAEDLPGLPNGWAWASWNDLVDWITYGFTRPMPHVSKGVPIITAKNVLDNSIDFSTVDYTTAAAFGELSEKDRPRKGEILLTKDGSIGRAAIVDTGKAFCINQSVAVLRFGGFTAHIPYLLRVIQSPLTQRSIEESAGGTAMPHISITTFGTFPVPLPPLREQQEIAHRVDALFALQETITKRVTIGHRRLRDLPQAILNKAFRGELVQTEAKLAELESRDYEPAAWLLERVLATNFERATNRRRLPGDALRRR